MYKIIIRDMTIANKVVSELELSKEYKTRESCMETIRKLADSQKDIYYRPATLVQHHAGESVAFFKGGDYKEFTRSAWIPKQMEG